MFAFPQILTLYSACDTPAKNLADLPPAPHCNRLKNSFLVNRSCSLIPNALQLKLLQIWLYLSLTDLLKSNVMFFSKLLINFNNISPNLRYKFQISKPHVTWWYLAHNRKELLRWHSVWHPKFLTHENNVSFVIIIIIILSRKIIYDHKIIHLGVLISFPMVLRRGESRGEENCLP